MALCSESTGSSVAPAARAVAAMCPATSVAVSDVREIPGVGIEGRIAGRTYRLGRPDRSDPPIGSDGGASETWLSVDHQVLGSFRISDSLRPGAVEAVGRLQGLGLGTEILSGDARRVVGETAALVGVPKATGDMLPSDKVARLQDLAAHGRKVLMVGDGLNDAPALGTAYVSIAPSSAEDVGRNAADLVFLRASLQCVPDAIEIARTARRLVTQNIALSIAYNALALPLALAGLVTPLVAAIAMSTSSILVVANALRLAAPGGLHARSHCREATTRLAAAQ